MEGKGGGRCCSALAVRCLFKDGHARQQLLFQTTVKRKRKKIAGVHLASIAEGAKRGTRGNAGEVESHMHVWVVQ